MEDIMDAKSIEVGHFYIFLESDGSEGIIKIKKAPHRVKKSIHVEGSKFSYKKLALSSVVTCVPLECESELLANIKKEITWEEFMQKGKHYLLFLVS